MPEWHECLNDIKCTVIVFEESLLYIKGVGYGGL